MIFAFTAEIEIIGINPFVFVPGDILQEIFELSGKNKGPIPVKGTINNMVYTQTLVKYSGEWRLYINTVMLKNSPKRIGETVELTITYDPESREIEAPENFVKALNSNQEAKVVFEQMSPSKQMEIVRYLSRLKSEEVRNKNIERAIKFLLGKERFVGRDKP
ncbi:MAG: DUF1905 domain-containing protein [Saprospiraceae bacterium]|nr:DUF1905 domain-containing protein [Saprospiraceae bacterium]